MQPQSAQKQQKEIDEAFNAFLKSRREGISPNTIRDYSNTLPRTLNVLGLKPITAKINSYLRSLTCSLGGKYGYFKNIRAFYNWLYSPRSGYPFKSENNPVTWVDAPKRPTIILPSLSKEEVELLIEEANSVRDKAIIALFTESGVVRPQGYPQVEVVRERVEDLVAQFESQSFEGGSGQ